MRGTAATVVRDTPRYRDGVATCHLVAEDVEVLHRAAVRLGLLREWFQPDPYPHYDLIGLRAIKRAVRARIPLVQRRELVVIARASGASILQRD